MSAPPRILAVGEELPPMDAGEPRTRPAGSRPQPKGKSASAGRFAVLNAFVDFSLAGLSRGEVAVWLVLYRDTRDGTARTSYDELARRTGLNRRNVGRALRRLENLELVKVVRRGGLRQGASHYLIRGLAGEE